LIGPQTYAVAMSIVTALPKSPPHYKSLLPGQVGVGHMTVEIHRCGQGPGESATSLGYPRLQTLAFPCLTSLRNTVRETTWSSET